MILHELLHNVAYQVAIAPAATAGADNTALTGAIIDMQGYEHVTFVIVTGTLADADATFAVTLQHGDDPALSDAAAPSSDVLVGTLAGAGFTFADDSSTKKVGYTPGKGAGKRYVRLVVTPTGNAGAAPIAAVAAKLPLYRPAA